MLFTLEKSLPIFIQSIQPPSSILQTPKSPNLSKLTPKHPPPKPLQSQPQFKFSQPPYPPSSSSTTPNSFLQPPTIPLMPYDQQTTTTPPKFHPRLTPWRLTHHSFHIFTRCKSSWRVSLDLPLLPVWGTGDRLVGGNLRDSSSVLFIYDVTNFAL